MSIAFSCSSCHKQVNVPANMAGRKAKCPFCGALLQVPGRATAPKPARALRRQESRGGCGAGLAVGILILLLLGALGGGGYLVWRLRTPSVAEAEAEDFLNLPAECKWLAAIKLEQLRASPAFRQLLDKSPDFDRSMENAFRKASGMKLDDAERVLAGGRFNDSNETVLLIKTTRLVTTADVSLPDSGPAEAYKIGKFAVSERGTEAFALLNNRTVLRGKTETLRRLLQRDRTSRVAPAILNVLQQADLSQPAVVAVDGNVLALGSTLPEALDLAQAIKPSDQVDAVLLECQPDTGLDVHATAFCRDVRSMQLLKHRLDAGLVGLKKESKGSGGDILSLLRSTYLSLGQSRVIASIWLDPVQLAQPLAALRQEQTDFLLGALNDDSADHRTQARQKLLAMGPRILPQLREALAEPSPRLRQGALAVLGDMGPAAAPAAAAVAAILKDKETVLRVQAAGSLEKIGPKAKQAALPGLLAALADPEEQVCQAAARTLEKLGAPTKEDVAVLKAAAGDSGQDSHIRLYALAELGKIDLGADASVALFSVALKDRDKEVRLAAARALGKLGKDPRGKVQTVLLDGLKDKDKDVRVAIVEALDGLGAPKPEDAGRLAAVLRQAGAAPEARAYCARALARLGPDAREAGVALLFEVMHDRDKEIRAAAAEVIQNLGPPAPLDVAIVLSALRDKTGPAEVRSAAAGQLAKLGPGARDAAFRDLLDALKDKELEVRAAAGAALAKLGPPDLADKPALAAALGDEAASPELRIYAAEALGSFGSQAEVDVFLLIKAIHDADKAVRIAVARALAKIRPQLGSKEAVAALAALLQDRDKEVRLAATEALVQMGPEAGNLPGLLKALEDEDPLVVSAAGAALAKGSEATAADVPTLVAALASKKTQVRAFAAEALAGIGPDARAAVEPLGKAVHDKEANIRALAIIALRALGPAGKPAAAALIEALKDEDKRVQVQAAATLLKLNVDVKAAAQVLLAALKEKDDELRNLAAKVLGSLGPDAADAAPFLARSLEDDEARPVAVQALVRMGKTAIPELMQASVNKDAKVRLAAVDAIGQIGRPAYTVPVFNALDRLRNNDPDDAVREAARNSQRLIQAPPSK